MMNDYEPKTKSLCGLFRDSFQLMFGHFPMRIVIDSVNFAAILDRADDAPEINDCARAGDVAPLRRERRLCHRNFANGICHALKLLATVTLLRSAVTKGDTKMNTNQCDIGLIGLAVMGENLVLNMESKGFSVAVFNRTTEVTEKFAADRGKGKNIQPTRTMEEFVGALKKPRKAMIMVKAGTPVDAVIGELAPLLEKGDVIIDGGNSLFTDTQRRARELEAQEFILSAAVFPVAKKARSKVRR